jgi:hypothetical protein
MGITSSAEVFPKVLRCHSLHDTHWARYQPLYEDGQNEGCVDGPLVRESGKPAIKMTSLPKCHCDLSKCKHDLTILTSEI